MNHLPRAPGEYIDINVYNPDINFFLEKFKNREYFSMVRYQDTWWNTAKRASRICDGYVAPEVIGKVFARILNTQNYKITEEVAIENFRLIANPQPNLQISIKSMRAESSGLIPKLTPKVDFLYAHCWRQMARNGTILKMFKEFKNDTFIIVGPSYLKSLGSKLELPNFNYVEISGTNACSHFHKTIGEVVDLYCAVHDPDKKTFILSVGGYFGNALINRLHHQIDDAFILEMGRALDAFFCHDDTFRSMPKFWWSPFWLGPKNNMEPWTDKYKPMGDS